MDKLKMEISEVENADSSQCVRVAVNIRPLITSELLLGCTDCISVVPGEPRVQIGSHSFTYDYVYGGMGSPCSALYDDCVAPLVDALFHGYNATVLAYGQTGSGKTYTMGTNYTGDESNGGIIPKAMESIFRRVEAMKDSTKFFIKVSFIEIFEDKVFDLLDPNSSVFSKAEGASFAKPTMLARVPIQIKETVNGRITLVGVTEAEVMTKEEMAKHLSRGSHSRAIESTNMNSQSSHSHAIFTITMEQNKISHCLAGAINDDLGDDIVRAKLHLVDLAGFKRAKRTGADGMRFKEGISNVYYIGDFPWSRDFNAVTLGIHINKGLLALGNVISALGDEKKRKEGGHVPYRDNKLTRLLQDSLGRRSKTVMIVCVSPADTNVEETINTLKYANRVHNSQNKINRDSMAAQEQRMTGGRVCSNTIRQDTIVARSKKDSDIRDLKEKIEKLGSSGRQLEMQKPEPKQLVKSQDHGSSIFLLGDMDTSESEYSDWETTDDEWIASVKRRGRKRNTKNRGRSSAASGQSDRKDSESLKLGRSGEGITGETANTPSGACCSCSKYSSCKTTKCPCRAAGGSCGSSCGCVPMKCANRESEKLNI